MTILTSLLFPCHRLLQCILLLSGLLAGQVAFAQVCAAPGKDAPGTISGVVNTYFQVSGNLAANATSLILGTSTGAASPVSVGDMLMIIQMQGASINSTDSDAYGDGTASGAANNLVLSATGQANGYTDIGRAGLYEYVRVTSVSGTNILFTPALINFYEQNTSVQPRRTYQVIRVPQYPSATISTASPLTPLTWNGLTGGVVSIDVAGTLNHTGAGAHINASNQGFRGGAQGGSDSSCCNGTYWFFTSALTADGGGKGEGVAGTPRYLSLNTAGSFDRGTGYNDPGILINNMLDNTAGHMGYPNGDFARGAPANAGGGGTSHNSGGGGGGNGGIGGSGGQTFNNDGLRDVGGFGGSRVPQTGSPVATSMFMGGGGGSGSLNNDTVNLGSGGYGGGIIAVRAGSISGSAAYQTNGQKGIDSYAGQDAGGGGGAGGTVLVIAGSGHGNVTAIARGGYGSNSNLNTSNSGFTPPDGQSNTNCCGGEREGPGGGGGGGVVISNAPLGSTVLTRGINGLSREDKAQGFSGNMLASPGTDGAQAIVSSTLVAGVRPGYECLPVLTVTKSTSTPTRTVPPDTIGSYVVVLSNAATAGVAYAVGLSDLLSAPFTLSGASASVSYGAGASGPASPIAASGTNNAIIGTAGNATDSFTLNPGGRLTVTFNVALNSAAAGTYQNSINLRFTDATRTSGGSAQGAGNATVSPGGAYASGQPVGGSNYNAASSTQEDILISGTPGTTADLVITKNGTSSAEVGQHVAYTLLVSNNGPANVPGTITISDIVPANIGTVTWVCTLMAGTADCDTSTGGAGSAGSGNAISLPRVALASGGQIQIAVSGTAISAGTAVNTVTVNLPAGFNDPTPSNNRATATTTITTPSADLSISKSNDVTTVTSGSVTAYSIVVRNSGPSSANNSVLTDTPSTGLMLLSITCSTQGGAVCPVSISTNTFQTGLTIATFPAGSSLTFTVNAQVTATSGNITNSASIVPPLGTIDPTVPNNSSDSDVVVPAATRVISSASICPAGTTEQLLNLVSNGDYVDIAQGVGASVTQGASNAYPADTTVALQSGAKNYVSGVVIQNPFPGDVSRSVAGTNNWLYSNGNNTGAAYRIWSQSVTGLMIGRSYQWMYYGSNALASGSAATDLPLIDFRVVTGTVTASLGAADSYPNEGAGVTDTWTLRQRTFVAGANAVTLQLWDTVLGATGDDFANTQIILRECRPNVDVYVSKSNGVNQVTALGTTAYVITVGNAGPGDADNVTVRDPVAVGLNKTGVSCSATGVGAACPPLVNVSGFEGAGLLIPTLPLGTTVVFTVTASVTALNGSVTNAVSLTLPSGIVDGTPTNNNAFDTDNVLAVAAISITKTNNASTLVAGSTTNYTITVANAGPSDASNSVLRDPAAPGLRCIGPVTCTASGGASCGAPSIALATLQSGFTIPSFPGGGQIVLSLSCGVTATGQ